MVTFLSRLIGLTPAGDSAPPGQVDAMLLDRHTAEMAPSNDLIAVDVHTEDVGDYSVTEPGWYAVDDGGKVVLGPFDSLAQCEQAIRDRLQRLTKSQIPPVPN
jgi:hypothetical protein